MGIIGSIRKHSWIAVTIVGIAIVAFIIGDLTKNRSGMSNVGEINGETITWQHFEAKVTEIEDMYKMQNGMTSVPSEVEIQIREQVWQTLLEDNLFGAEFDALGLTVSPAEVSDMYLGKFLHPYVRQQFTDPATGQYNYEQVRNLTEHFDELDSTVRMQWIDLEKNVKKNRLQMKYQTLLASGFYMPKPFAQLIADINAKTRTVDVVSLPLSSVEDSEVSLTDDDYKKYYEQHKAEFRVAEELRDVDMVVFNIVPTQADLQEIQDTFMSVWQRFQTVDISEIPYFVSGESDHSYDSTFRKSSEFEQIDSLVAGLSAGQYIEPRIVGNEWVMGKVLATAFRPDSLRASAIYILNQNAGGNITRTAEDAEKLADSLTAQIQAGRLDFDKALAEFSDDPEKNNTKGDMNWAADGAYGMINEQVVNTPVGGVFKFEIPSGAGYFIVKVTGKTQALKKYRLALIEKEIVPSEATARDIFNQAHTFAANNRSMQEMQASAQAEGMQVRSARLTSMMNTINNLEGARSIVQWAFKEETEIGSVADQVYEANDAYVVVALKDVFKKGYATLDQVRPMIESQVMNEKKGEMLLARAEEAANGATTIDQVAAKLQVAVDTVTSSTFNGYFFGKFGMEPKMLGAVAAAKTGTLMKPVKGANGVYVGLVTESLDAEETDSDAVVSTFEQSFGQKLRNIFSALRYNADIVDLRHLIY